MHEIYILCRRGTARLFCPKVQFSSYRSQLSNLVTGHSRSLAEKHWISVSPCCVAPQPSGYGLKLIRLTGMVGCLVSPPRFSVSQDKHTQKQTRPLWNNLPQLLQQTPNTMLDSAKLGLPHSDCSQFCGEKRDIHWRSKWSRLKHLGPRLVKDVLKTSTCHGAGENTSMVYEPSGKLHHYKSCPLDFPGKCHNQ